MSCECGTCRCKGKAVVERDEYDGLIEAAEPNLELRDAAIQLVAAAHDQGVEGIMRVWVERVERALG